MASSSSIVEFACPINSPCCNYPLKYLSKRSLPQGGRGINLNGPSRTLQDISNFDDSRNRSFCQNIWFNESIVEILPKSFRQCCSWEVFDPTVRSSGLGSGSLRGSKPSLHWGGQTGFLVMSKICVFFIFPT